MLSAEAADPGMDQFDSTVWTRCKGKLSKLGVHTGKDALASHTRVCRPCWTFWQDVHSPFFLPTWVCPFPTLSIALPQLLLWCLLTHLLPLEGGKQFSCLLPWPPDVQSFPSDLIRRGDLTALPQHHYHPAFLESWFVRWCCFTKTGWFIFDQAQLILKQPNINERNPELHLAMLFFLHSQTA